MYVELSTSGGSRAVRASTQAEGVTRILGDTDWEWTKHGVRRTGCAEGHNTPYSVRVISKKEYNTLKGIPTIPFKGV